MTTEITLTEQEFEDQFDPLDNHLDSLAAWNGWMYETYGDELNYVMQIHAQAPDRVWTILDCDGQLVISNGLSFVNRMGYIITTKPCPPDTFIDVPDDCEYGDDIEDEDEAA